MNESHVTQSSNKEAAQSRSAAARSSEAYLLPRIDVIEDSQGITLLADLPGVKRDKLDLRVEGDSLTLEAGIDIDAPKELQATFAEVRAPRYRRAFTLSSELDTARIDAQLKDGVMRLRIPKLAEAQPRRIEVRVD